MWAWIFAFSRAAFTVNRDASSVRDAAFAAAAIISSGAVGCWVGGILGDRWGRTRLTRLAMALSGTCCVLIGPVAATCPGERVVPGRGDHPSGDLGTGGRSGNGVVLAACLGMEQGRKSLADRAPGRTLASAKRAERPAVR